MTRWGFIQFFPPPTLLNFNHKNWWPCEDIEARDLKFCMQPCFIITHAGKKYENDPREKLQFRTLQSSLTFCPQSDLVVTDYCDYPVDVSLIFIQIPLTGIVPATHVTDNIYGVNIKTPEEAKNIWIYQL